MFFNLNYSDKTAEEMADSCIKNLYLKKKVLHEKLMLSLSCTIN